MPVAFQRKACVIEKSELTDRPDPTAPSTRRHGIVVQLVAFDWQRDVCFDML